MAYNSLPDFLNVQRESIPLGNGFDYGLQNVNNIMPMQFGAQPTQGSWMGNAANWVNQNGNTLNTVFNGLGALTSGFNSFRNYGLAKDNFNLQKRAFETNLRNSTKTYNNALEDRIRGRSAEASEADVQAQIARQRLGG